MAVTETEKEGQEFSQETNWLIDSGATNHVAKVAKHFAELKKMNVEMSMRTADGADTVATKAGVVNIFVDNGIDDKGSHVEINKVVHIPTFHQNILSVTALVDQGMAVTYRRDHCSITGSDGRQLISVPRAKDGLWYLHGKAKENAVPQTIMSCTQTDPDGVELVHKESSHLNGKLCCKPNEKEPVQQESTHMGDSTQDVLRSCSTAGTSGKFPEDIAKQKCEEQRE